MMAMQQHSSQQNMAGMSNPAFAFQNPNPDNMHMGGQGMMMNPMAMPGAGYMPQYQQQHQQQLMFGNEMFGGNGYGMDMGGMQPGMMFNPMMGGGSMIGQNMGNQMGPGWNGQWDPSMQ